jgi:hypothetical protein
MNMGIDKTKLVSAQMFERIFDYGEDYITLGSRKPGSMDDDAKPENGEVEAVSHLEILGNIKCELIINVAPRYEAWPREVNVRVSLDVLMKEERNLVVQETRPTITWIEALCD